MSISRLLAPIGDIYYYTFMLLSHIHITMFGDFFDF